MAGLDGRERARIVGDPQKTSVLLPVRIGAKRRTLVAKTCTGCGELHDADHFPFSGRASRTRDSRCRDCHAERLRLDYQRRNRVNGLRTQQARQQSLSVESATHGGEEWTGPQLEIALRDDLTALDAARLLGRTHLAVKGIRHRARTDDTLRKRADQAAS